MSSPLPCPFCGNEDIHVTAPARGGAWQVMCVRCQTRKSTYISGTDIEQMNAAVDAWNTRITNHKGADDE